MMHPEQQNQVQPTAPLSPKERLAVLRERHTATQQSELGVGLLEHEDGTRELIFSNLLENQVVAIPTTIQRESFERILDKALPLDETRLMLFELARAYEQRMPVMLEGGTALGKTFVVNLFSKLLYGEKAEIPDFYCNGQTDVSELMGKYVPAGLKPDDHKRVAQYLKSDQGAALKAEILSETAGKYEYQELYTRACAELGIPVQTNQFEFQLGVLPKAMTAGFSADGTLHYSPDGPGVMLHVQELGMAAPAVVNALLKIRGDRGRIAESIQVWEDGGRTVEAGKGFFVVFSTNPVGKGYQERFEIDKALARSLVWVNLPEKLSDDSLHKATSHIFRFDKIPAQAGTVIDLAEHQELAQALGAVMAQFHKVYTDMMESGESGRRQKVPATLDSLWRVAELVQELQIADSDFSSIDMISTLREAVKGIYINCLQDKPALIASRELKDAGNNSLGAKLLESFDQLLTNSTTSQVVHRGTEMTRAEQIEALTQAALVGESQVADRKEIKREAERVNSLKELSDTLKELKGKLPEQEFARLLPVATAELSDEERDQLFELL